MSYSFLAWGHKNITGTHRRTLEFTKDSELSLRGNCIIGVSANFDLNELKKLLKNGKTLKAEIKADGIYDTVVFEPNKEFNDEREIVIRKGDFISERTFGIKADKACIDLKRDLIEKIRNPNQKIEVKIIML